MRGCSRVDQAIIATARKGGLMLRWALLGIALLAFASLWGQGQEYVLLGAFVVMFANFATFCLLYDKPQERARLRVAEHSRQQTPNSAMAQRLEMAPLTLTAADRNLGFGRMTIANFVTGLAAVGLLGWGIFLRVG
jgi:hypothetical protein